MHAQPTPQPDMPHDTSAPGTSEPLVAFGNYLQRHGRTTGTRERYQRVLTGFISWLNGRPATSVKAKDIDQYLDHWQDTFFNRYERLPAIGSYRGQINALRSFYDYLDRFELLTDSTGILLRDPMRRIPCPPAQQPTNDWLKPAEDHALLTHHGTHQERILVHLLRWTGIRVSEAASLRLQDIDLTPGQEALTIRHSKTTAGKRTIPIIPELTPTLHDWLSALATQGQASPFTPLLATRHGTPMRHSYIWRLIKRTAHHAGVRPIHCTCNTPRPPHHPGCPQTRNGHNQSHITPHTLRRTFASHLLNNGLRLEIVSKLLGHASTTVTERAYAELLNDTTRKELLHTLNNTP